MPYLATFYLHNKTLRLWSTRMRALLTRVTAGAQLGYSHMCVKYPHAVLFCHTSPSVILIVIRVALVLLGADLVGRVGREQLV